MEKHYNQKAKDWINCGRIFGAGYNSLEGMELKQTSAEQEQSKKLAKLWLAGAEN